MNYEITTPKESKKRFIHKVGDVWKTKKETREVLKVDRKGFTFSYNKNLGTCGSCGCCPVRSGEKETGKKAFLFWINYNNAKLIKQ